MSSQTLANKGQIHINTDNWSSFHNKLNSNSKNTPTSQNPTSKDFDWKFHAGIINDKDFSKLNASYIKASTPLEKMYIMSNDAVNQFVKKWEKNKKHQKLILESFKNIKKVLNKNKFDENPKIDETVKLMYFKSSMVFYMENLKKNIHFSEGEEWLLVLCHKIALFTGTLEIETMIFLLYKAFLLKCKIKDFIFPIVELEVDGTKYSFYKKKELSRPHFFSFLIVYMFMKTKPDTVAHLFDEKHAPKTKFFNNFIKSVFDFFIYNLPFKISNIDTLSPDVRKIFGEVLKKKNPLPLFAYIIAYLKAYTPDNLKLTFPCKKCGHHSTTDPETANQLFQKLVESVGFTDKNKTIKESTSIKQSIPDADYRKIKEYLDSNVSKIAKIARGRLIKKKKSDGSKSITFSFPNSLKKPILQSGGNRKFVKTRKKYKSSKNKSFKKYD